MDSVPPLTDAIRANYDWHIKVTFRENGNGCFLWEGPHLMPSYLGGPRTPVLVDGYDVYVAAKVGYAIVNGEAEYPLSGYRMTCGNPWCCNGKHVALVEHSRTGRKTKALEDTTKYEARRAFILDALRANPNLTHYEIFNLLKARKLGGKNITISRIVGRCRAELKLPARVSRPRVRPDGTTQSSENDDPGKH